MSHKKSRGGPWKEQEKKKKDGRREERRKKGKKGGQREGRKERGGIREDRLAKIPMFSFISKLCFHSFVITFLF